MCNTCAKQYTCTERKQNCTEKITYVQAGILEQPERRRDERHYTNANI